MVVCSKGNNKGNKDALNNAIFQSLIKDKVFTFAKNYVLFLSMSFLKHIYLYFSSCGEDKGKMVTLEEL